MKEEKERKVNKIRNRSLSFSLRLLFVLIVLIITVSFMIYVHQVTDKERRENVTRESESIIKGLSDIIYNDIERYMELSRLVMTNDKLTKFLRANSDSITLTLVETAKEGIHSVLNVTSMVDSVFIFRNDSQYLVTSPDKYDINYDRIDTPEWRNNIIEKGGRAIISLNGDGAVSRADGKQLITISRAIHDIVSQNRTGIMLMNLSVSIIEQKIKSLKNDDIFVISTDGTFLGGNESLKEYYDQSFESETFVHKQVKVDEAEMMVSGLKIPEMPVVVMTVSHIRKGIIMEETVIMLTCLIVVFFAVILFAGAFITKNITRPVLEMTKAMEKNKEEGILQKIDVVKPNNEIGMLEDSYNNMVEHVNVLFDRLIEKEQTVQRAEMRVLQEQIKPHFLYNSLETIGYLAMDEGAEKVHSALETLGSFYRNFLSKGDREIPLKREIVIIKDYLSLQKLRYGDIINDEYEIDKDTEEFIIPKLILQPLVENSIYHGIRMKGECGTIKVSSHLKDGELHLIVRDTGVGMTQEQIDKVLSGEKREPVGEQGGSFGLWGTIERIRCYCDRDDVATIRSEMGEYTEIELTISQASKSRYHTHKEND